MVLGCNGDISGFVCLHAVSFACMQFRLFHLPSPLDPLFICSSFVYMQFHLLTCIFVGLHAVHVLTCSFVCFFVRGYVVVCGVFYLAYRSW